MDVIDVWNGRNACALQLAFRMTNEAFAAHLGVAVRTVAKWHAAPDAVPRSDMQQILDVAYERAEARVQRRFSLLSRPPEGPAQAQALRVAIAVVMRADEVLLVCRRDGGALDWQFPAGMVKPGGTPEAVAVQETHAETGVHCTIRQHLGERLHPVTGVLAHYYLCDYLAGDATNRDLVENIDVTWAPRSALSRFIPTEKIYPPILSALEDA
ncbi:NUDIX hydrolase [Streptomyces sp. NPDC059569]|uniref:NUDIX hydrolase n=1 Tax=Streptomyces sp. NPDC059569 TaxID=3346869 RepID=UPI0036CEB4E8